MKMLNRPALGFYAGWVMLFTLQTSQAVASNIVSDLIWAGNDEFVRLVPLEEHAQRSNDHPSNHSPAQLAAGLRAIEVFKSDSDNPSRQALFDDATSQQLGALLAEALAEARPDQDVLFAIITSRPAGLLGKHKESISARVFVAQGRLNLILGDVFRSTLPEGFHSDPNRVRQIDRRLEPHLAGSRSESLVSGYAVAFKGAVERPDSARKDRSDWVLLDLDRSFEPALGQSAADHQNTSTLEARLEKLKALRANELIDDQSYRTLVEELVRSQLLQ